MAHPSAPRQVAFCYPFTLYSQNTEHRKLTVAYPCPEEKKKRQKGTAPQNHSMPCSWLKAHESKKNNKQQLKGSSL